MQETQTAVTLSLSELNALRDLLHVARLRLTTGENLFFNALLARFALELAAQEKDINQAREYLDTNVR